MLVKSNYPNTFKVCMIDFFEYKALFVFLRGQRKARPFLEAIFLSEIEINFY